MTRAIVVALGLAIAATSIAQDEPETVYAKFHRAGLVGDYDAMLQYETAADAVVAAQRKRLLEVLARLLPRSYSVMEKTVEEGGKRAVLRLRGTQPDALGKPQSLSGTITFVKQKGEWKIDEASWAER